MTHFRYYTSDALENLRSTVADHLDWYHAPVRELPSNSLGGFRESKVEAPVWVYFRCSSEGGYSFAVAARKEFLLSSDLS